MSPPSRHDVDVVIPTRDRPEQLAATLAALWRQTSDRFGVIVVDDGGRVPAEGSTPIPAGDGPANRWVHNETSIGPGPSRNRGVAVSDAPYIVFLDDDCLAEPTLIERHLAALEVGAVVSLGPILAPPHRRLEAWNHWDADRLERRYARLGDGTAAPGWTDVYTGNLGVRRQDFEAVGGFDDRFTRQEDMELGYRLGRLGCRLAFDAGAVVFHDSARTLGGWKGIPVASARFDVLTDQLVPDSGRLDSVLAEQQAKHWAVRLVRRVGATPIGQRCAVFAVVTVGRVLHALGARRAALPAFSVAWDLIYNDALRNELADASHPRPDEPAP